MQYKHFLLMKNLKNTSGAQLWIVNLNSIEKIQKYGKCPALWQFLWTRAEHLKYILIF